MEKTAINTAAALAYTNVDIISRFTDMFDVSWEEAEDLFIETKKFLCISTHPGVLVPDDLLILDEMWHNFICFTKEYAAWGHANFGHYLHHTPASRAEKDAKDAQIAVNFAQAQQQYLACIELIMNLAYDAYGEATVDKWFRIYPEKYSLANVKALRK